MGYITCLFFKENSFASTTPPRFLAYVRQEYPFLLDSAWQRERIQEMRAVYGRRKVLVDRTGFTSLIRPHTIVRLAEAAP